MYIQELDILRDKRLFESHDKHNAFDVVAAGIFSNLGKSNVNPTAKEKKRIIEILGQNIQVVSNDYGVRRPFGIVKLVNATGEDAVVHECTKEDFDRCLNSPDVAEVKRKVMELKQKMNDGIITKAEYEEKTSTEKKKLPAITPFGTFQGGVRKSKLLQPSGLNMLDYDEEQQDCDDFVVRLMQKIEKARLLPYVGLVQTSIRGKGAHVIYINPEDMDVKTGQAWFASKVGEPNYDKSCKDGARPLFFSTAADVVYRNDNVLFGFGPKAPRATVDEFNDAAKLLESKGVKSGKGGDASQGKLREVEWDDQNLPTDYCGVPLKKIVDEYVKRVLGGEPAVGSRHNTLRPLMQQIAGICNFNPALIASVVPDCGLPRYEFVELAKFAAQTSSGRTSHELDGIISELRAEAAVTGQNADGATTVLPNAMQAAVGAAEDADEEWSVDKFYETTKRKIIEDFIAIVPHLPAPIRDTLMPVEKDMQLAVFLSIMPVLATAADGVLVESVDEGLKSMAIYTVVQGGPASNKGWCVKAVKMWLHVFEQEDELAEQKFEEEMEVWENKKGRKRKKDMPKCPRRVLPIDFTNAAYIDWAENIPGHAVISYSPETSFLIDSNKAGAFAKTIKIFLVGYDGDEYAHQRYGKDSKSGKVNARMNLTMVGTDIAFDELFSDININNGLASRFFPYTLDEDDDKDFGPAPKEPKWSAAVHREVDDAIRRLCQAEGTESTPRSLEAVNAWQEGVKRFAKSLNRDHEMAKCSFRAAPDALKVGAILKLLTPDREETDATVQATIVAAKIKWLEQYYRFGMTMRNHRVNKNNKKSAKAEKRFSPNYVVLAMMPDEFTTDSFIEAKQKQTGKEVNERSLRSKLSQFVSRGDIEQIAENKFRKILSA